MFRRLAVGGMAEIYLARDHQLAGATRLVAIKCLLPHLVNDAASIGGFHDEARLLASLHHPNITQVFEIGIHRGIHFFVMEYLDGETVQTILKAARARGRTPDLATACLIAIRAADGLRHAHEMRSEAGVPMNIVHRDVTPANILVGREGGLKLLDFGIAKSSRSSERTETGLVKGTVCYMSPEQCLGDVLDPRSDVFSLGVVLYELTTLVQPFAVDGELPQLTMERIIGGKCKCPRERVNDYPAELEAIVMKAMSNSRDHRFATAREMLLALEGFAAGHRLPLSSVHLANFMGSVSEARPRQRTILAPVEPVTTTTTCLRRRTSDAAQGQSTDAMLTSRWSARPTLSLLPATNIYSAADSSRFEIRVSGTARDWSAVSTPQPQPPQRRQVRRFIVALSTLFALTGFIVLALYVALST